MTSDRDSTQPFRLPATETPTDVRHLPPADGGPAKGPEPDDTSPSHQVRGDVLSGTYTVHGVRVRFIGRRDELAGLMELAEGLRSGSGAAATVLGPPGSGKTRLLYEFAARLAHRHHSFQLTLVRCRDEGRPLPHEPFRRLIRTILDLEPGSGAPAALHNLEAHTPLWNLPPTEKAEAVAILVRLLGHVPEGDVTPPRVETEDRLEWAVGHLLRAETSRRPLLLAFDEAGAADKATASLAAAMTRELRGAPATILVLARRLGGPLAQCTYDRRFNLGPLTQRQSLLMLRAILSRVPSPPTELLKLVLERAQGNPYAIEELVRLLIETGALDASGEPWLVDLNQLADAADELPRTVEDIVRIRVASLSRQERETLRKAAVFGEVFIDGAIAMIDLLEGRKLEDLELFGEADRAQLDRTLAALVRKDLIMLRAASPTGADDREYAFKHPRVRRQLYDGIDETRQRRYHYLIAQWMGARVGAGADPEAVAEHFEEAAHLREAARYYVRAGDRARNSGALERALEFFERALELLDHDDVTPRHHALRALGEVHLLLGQNDEARRAFRATLRAAAALGDRAAAGAALRALGRLFLRQGDYDMAQRYLDRACELLAAASAADGLADALDLRASLALYRGSYRAVDEALADRRKALQIRRSTVEGDQTPIARSLVGIGELLTARGALRAAEESYREATELLRRSNARADLAGALEGLANVHAERKAWEQAVPLVSEALQIAEQLGDRRRKGSLLIALGLGQLKLGRVGDAVASLNEAMELVGALGDRFAVGEAQRALAQAYTALDEHRRAEDLCEEAVRVAEVLGSKLSLSRSLRALGDALSSEIYTDQKGTDPNPRHLRANDVYRRAILIFEEMGHELELAKSYVEYGRFLTEFGDAKKGSQYLSRADEIRNRAEGTQNRGFIPALTPSPLPTGGRRR